MITIEVAGEGTQTKLDILAEYGVDMIKTWGALRYHKNGVIWYDHNGSWRVKFTHWMWIFEKWILWNDVVELKQLLWRSYIFINCYCVRLYFDGWIKLKVTMTMISGKTEIMIKHQLCCSCNQLSINMFWMNTDNGSSTKRGKFRTWEKFSSEASSDVWKTTRT